MARCRCGATICTCALVPGDNVLLTGSGSADDPWVLRFQPTATGAIAVLDTPTLDLQMTGQGTQANPYVLSGTVIPVPGPAGPGVPPGGNTNQILAKLSPADFDTQWLNAPIAPNGLPPAGGVGEVLMKTGVPDYEADWQPLPAFGTTILNGQDPPDVLLGVPGDYYADTLNGVLYGPKSTSGWGTAQIPTINHTVPDGHLFNTIGGRYRFARPGRITGLRYRRRADDNTTYGIFVFDTAGNKLVDMTDVQAAVAGQFTVTFPTPLIVQAGAERVFAYGAQNPGTAYRLTASTVTATADVSFVQWVQSGGAIGSYPSNPATEFAYVEPIFEANEAWPVTVRYVDRARLADSVVPGSILAASIASGQITAPKISTQFMQTGLATIPGNGADVTVNFSPAFASAPRVFISYGDGIVLSGEVNPAAVLDVTASSFRAHRYFTHEAGLTIYWQAIYGMG